MAILWAGGEDLDFPFGNAITTDDTLGRQRSGYARTIVYQTANPGYARSYAFPGGAVTSVWLSCQYSSNDYFGSGYTNPQCIGLGLSGTNKGIFIGCAVANKLSISKFDGTTNTALVVESGISEPTSTTTPIRLDLQILNYGVSGTVNLYLAGTLLITYTGDLTISGLSNFDCVVVARSGTTQHYCSEIIVADESTIGFLGLVTMAPNAAGTTDQWTGAYTDVNEISLNNGTAITTTVSAQDEQFNLIDLPAGTFGIKAVVCTANAVAAAGTGGPSQISFGFNSGGSVAVGAAQSPAAAYAPLTRIFATNPVTSAAWAQSQMNGLQVNLRSV